MDCSMKNKKRVKHKFLMVTLIMGVLLSGCSLQQESQQKKETENYATPIATFHDVGSTINNMKKISNTMGYMLFDQEEARVKIKLNLEGVSRFDKFDDVRCYLDDNMVSDQTVILQGADHILEFEITEYVKKFNKIEVSCDGETEMIEVGDYRLERFKGDEISENQKMELVAYEKEDAINMFDGEFQIDGDREKYKLQYYVPKEVLDFAEVKINAQDVDGTYKIHCECAKEKLKEQGLYSVEFDMYILQVSKEDGSRNVVCKCFIPLTIK